MSDAKTIRAETVRRIAEAFDVEPELLVMSDREFHWWLHNTNEGRALLESEKS